MMKFDYNEWIAKLDCLINLIKQRKLYTRSDSDYRSNCYWHYSSWKKLLAMCIFAMVFTFVGCNNQKDKLIGEWKVNAKQSINLIKKEKNMNQMQERILEGVLTKIKYEFTKNKMITRVEGKTPFTFDTQNGTYNIKNITDNKIKLKLENGDEPLFIFKSDKKAILKTTMNGERSIVLYKVE